MTRTKRKPAWHHLLIGFLLFVFATNVFAGKKNDGESLSYLKKEKQPSGDLYNLLELNYALLNAADLISTFEGLERGAVEANPVAKLWIENKPLAIFAKTGLTIGALATLRYTRRYNHKAAIITLSCMNLLYSAVVANNIRISIQLSK